MAESATSPLFALNTLLAQVNQAIAAADDEAALLHTLCDLAVRHGRLALAFIARPDDDGRFVFLAAAGRVAYLDGLFISSRDDVPEGQGSTGRAWRENRAYFNTSFVHTAFLAPWRERALAHGVTASAALPIVRGGRVWGVFTVYRDDDALFDPPLQALLQELALDIGRGLDRVHDVQQLRLLRAALQALDDGVLVSDAQGRMLYANPGFSRITGYSPQDILGRDCSLLQSPDTDARAVAQIARAVASGQPYSGEILNRRKDGSTFWNLLRIDPVRNADGVLTAFVGVQRDVTAQREDRLLTRALLDNAAVGIMVVRDCRVVQCNARMGSLLGNAPQAMLGQTVRAMLRDDAAYARVERGCAQLRQDGTVALHGVPLAHRSGRTLLCDLFGVQLDGGQAAVWTVEDVTERALQAQQLARLAAIARVQAQVHASAAQADGAQQLHDRVCAALVAELQAPLAWVGQWPVDAASGSAMPVALLAAAGDTAALHAALAPGAPQEPAADLLDAVARVAHTRQPVFGSAQAPCVAALPVGDGNPAQLVLSLSLCLPGEHCAVASAFDAPTQQALRGVADSVSQGLQLIAQRESMRRLQRIHQALAAEADVLLQGRSAQDMLDRTCARLSEGAQFEAVWIVRPDEQGVLRVLARAGRGFERVDLSQIRADDATAIAAKAWRAQDTVVHQNNIAQQRGRPWAQALAEAGWVSALAVPLRRGGQQFAVMVFAAGRDVFDAQTVTACERVASLLGHGLDEFDLKERLVALQAQEAVAARTDRLTGLPNRLALEQHLPLALARAQRHDSLVAVGMIDLDDFKPVNDRYGHIVGDQLLRTLAQTLRAALRSADFVARLGGDEFVLVLEDLSARRYRQELGALCDRLAAAVDRDVDLGQGRIARVGMTLGLALYPLDAKEPDALLRLADAAMYQAKTRKTSRAQWWRLWREETADVGQAEAPFDPFGDEAQALLQALQPALQIVGDDFAAGFYALLQREAELQAIFASLSPQEFDALKATQAQHLRFLLDPQTSAQQITARARRLGQVHALIGVSSAALAQAMSYYGELLRAQLNELPLGQQARYRTLHAAQTRLQLDGQAQLDAMQTVSDAYHAMLSLPLPRHGRWIDLAQTELEHLGTLPGLPAALLFRPDASGTLALEAGAGTAAARITQVLRERNLYPSILPTADGRRGPMATAWISGQRQVVDAYLLDARLAPWHALARELGVRSAVALPVKRQEMVEAIVFLLGAHPHQFSAGTLQVWLDAVQSRWDQLAAMAAQPPLQVDAGRIAQLRTLLYENGLRMWMQPVVDLRTGQVVRVEALARLQDTQGQLLGPGVFLPVFSDTDLDVLFRKGLDMSLRELHRWRETGLDIALSINIAPSTLVHPDCPQWVERALRDTDTAPTLLTVELLESQTTDGAQADEAIDRLSALGVRLAMDDLGSGYSSLNRLAALPFDAIKIDQDLVKDVGRNPLQGIALMRTVLQIGLDLECDVIAEGLENDDLIEAAMLLGCGLGQGYGLSPPMPPDDLLPWIRARTPLPLPSGAELHSWLGATTYAWRLAHDTELQRNRGNLEHCPLTRFFAARGVSDASVLHWHAQWHRSAFDKERHTAAKLLMQWMAEQTLRQQGG